MWWIVVWSKVWRVGTRVVHTQNSWLWETETLQPNIWPVFVSRGFWTSVRSGFAEMVQDQVLQPVNLIEHWTGKHLHNVILSSVPFDDPGYLCLPGWEYFSHFNRELEHVFTHHRNESVLGFYDFVHSGSATETLSITYGFSNGILSSHFGISVPSNGITISGSWDSFCVGFANGISNRLK